jgi:Fur family ferric uptake transcriptional regulator
MATLGEESQRMQSDEARQMLKHAGLRVTHARLAILQLLHEHRVPFSHGDVCRRLRDIDADDSTLFRALNDMTNTGMLSRFDLGDHVWRYELRNYADRHNGKHPHFLCLACGKLLCLAMNDIGLSEGFRTMHAAIEQVSEVLLKGRCTDCQRLGIVADNAGR